MEKAETIEEKIVAILHDVLEDCPDYKLEVLDLLADHADLLAALLSVTRFPSETYREFVRRAKTDPIGRKVKILDIEDHVDRAFTDELKGMVKVRYSKALAYLKDEIDDY